MQIIEATLNPLSWHIQSIQVSQDGSGGGYSVSIEAIGPVAQPYVKFTHGPLFPKNSGVALPDIDKDPACECGAEKAKTTHSSWCPMVKP